jgi:hypothetical protein
MLHDDWEIYGDGTGNPEVLMFQPAKRILDICDKYGANLPFMRKSASNRICSMLPGKNGLAMPWLLLLEGVSFRRSIPNMNYCPTGRVGGCANHPQPCTMF